MSDRTFRTSFSSGEIDEGLQERVDLKAYQSGLNTARNVNVTKRGTIVSRAGRQYVTLLNTLADGGITQVKIFPLKSGLFLVFAVRTDSSITNEIAWLFNASGTFLSGSILSSGSISNIYDKFFIRTIDESDGDTNLVTYSEIVRALTTSVDISGTSITSAGLNTFFYVPSSDLSTSSLSSSTYGGNGYVVDYLVTAVREEDEEVPLLTVVSASAKLPVAATERNDLGLTVTYSAVRRNEVVELRVYRRPSNGGAYGYVGSSREITSTGALFDIFNFADFGQEADFTHQPPVSITDTTDLNAEIINAAVAYQSRFLVAVVDKIYASRTDLPYNLQRDFPYNDISALSFKPSSSSTGQILHMMDYNGLLIFSERGLFYHTGVLGPDNLNCTYQGPWRIDEYVPPIEVPGSVLFVDTSTNVVREIQYSEASQSLNATEVSIFSDHLFAENKITSWAFQDGELPLLHVTFSDGTYATFTYQLEHKMRAWTRCDSGVGVKQVIALPRVEASATGSAKFEADIIFLCDDGAGTYTIEKSAPRYLKPQELLTNPEADKGPVIAAMDSMVSWSHLILDDLVDDDMVLTPVVALTWDGDLTLSVTDDAIFPDPGLGAVGTFFKWFNPVDRTEILLEVTARASDDSITVTPSREFPSAYATNARLYEAKTAFSGFTHMEGESVSVVADGYVIASPNNNIENYDAQTVSSGAITLDDPYCIVHIGRPRTCDVETLAITEVGQGRGVQYSRLESFTCNRVFIRVKDTRGLYAGNRFPVNDLVEGDDVTGTNQIALDGFSSYDVNYEAQNPIIGNRYDQPYTRTVEITTPGDFDGLGKVAIRQVDPVHFEILSITPDIEILPVGG